jgi:N-acetylglucosamine-6-phosphate deacetylase
MEVYKRNIPIIVKVIKEDEFRIRIPGIHLDGPFICREDGVSSCHNKENILDPDPLILDQLLGFSEGKLLLLTIAAELDGAVELANYASAQGVEVSLGHQMAGSADIRHVVRVGAKMLTHFGNGVPVMVNRQHNPLWPGLVEESLMAAIITDGLHLTNDIIKAVLQVKGEDKTIVTSDMTAVTGLKPGKYTLFGGIRIVLEANNAVFMENGDCFAGSAMTALQCANYLLKQDLVDIRVIQKICFYNPLRLLGIDPKIILCSVSPLIKVTHRGLLDRIDPDDMF